MNTWKKDIAFLSTLAILAGMLEGSLLGLGVLVPPVVVGGVLLALTLTVIGVRVYARLVGEANTKADDTLDTLEDITADAAPVLPKKPIKPLSKVGPALMLFLLATACAPSLATSRASGIEARKAGVAASTAGRCTKLSRQEHSLRIASVTACALGGAAGLSTIPTHNEDVQTGFVLASAGFAVSCMTLEAVRGAVAARYIKECQ